MGAGSLLAAGWMDGLALLTPLSPLTDVLSRPRLFKTLNFAGTLGFSAESVQELPGHFCGGLVILTANKSQANPQPRKDVAEPPHRSPAPAGLPTSIQRPVKNLTEEQGFVADGPRLRSIVAKHSILQEVVVGFELGP
ncbi:hypothetical protein B0H14DRAFT_3730708 [Mycena olivaceomarginata]|nr:hypothetical protein B0H14DRAFT_3730708 [Mycena olivaceomarginata]